MSVRKRLVIEVEWEGACDERRWAEQLRKAIEVAGDGGDANCRVMRISGTHVGHTPVQADPERKASLEQIESEIDFELHLLPDTQ